MIEIDDIKVGLEFKLPFIENEYEEETTRNRHRKIMSEYGWKLPMFRTDLKTIEGVKLFITPYRPIFKVIDFPKDYFELAFKPSYYLGSFIKVTCGDNIFSLSTEDVIGRGEILEKFDPKKIAINPTYCPKNDWFYHVAFDSGSPCGSKTGFMSSKLSPNIVDDTSDAKAFRDITNKMYDTFKQKNTDYGNSFHKIFKECGMTYAYGHMAEKLERINSLRKNEAKVKGESMKDSLYDLANYAILTIIELEKKEKK